MLEQHPPNGVSGGKEYTGFLEVEAVTAPKEEAQKDMYLKVLWGTAIYNMIADVQKRIPDRKMTYCARLLIRVGYLAFLRSVEREGKE